MDDLSPQKIIERVKDVDARAKAAGVAMTKVCKSVGVSHTTWQRWRKGESSPRIDNLYKVEAEAERAIAAKPKAGEAA